MNRHLLKILQLMKWIVVCAIAVVLALIAAIQIDQRLMRRDAEKLLSDLRKLEVGVTSTAEAQIILRRWPNAAKPEGDCKKSCWIAITLNDFSWKHNGFFARHRRLYSLYNKLGGHLAEVKTAAGFTNGTFYADTVGFYLYVAEDKTTAWADYTLIGAAGDEPESLRPGWPAYRVRNPLHPTYFLRAGGGCEVCLVMSVVFMPEVTSFDRNRLKQMDFSCLTRWRHPCRTQSDVMPVAWQQYMDDQASK